MPDLPAAALLLSLLALLAPAGIRAAPSPVVISSTAEIDAPADELWRILVDLERYPEWNPFTPGVVSTLRPGDPIRMDVQMGGKRRVQTETVSVHEPGRRLCWDVTMGWRGLLNTRRCQTLEPLFTGGTRYQTRLEMHGLLAGLVNRLYGQHIQKGFDDLAAALRTRGEGRSAIR